LLARHDGSVKCISFQEFRPPERHLRRTQYARALVHHHGQRFSTSSLATTSDAENSGKVTFGFGKTQQDRKHWPVQKGIHQHYYKLINFLSDTNIGENVADFAPSIQN
jgi:hypothetical protein